MATEPVKKFGKHERRLVICEVEKKFSVKLDAKVKGREKWRRDESGKDWWILGGSQMPDKPIWYGIPPNMMEAEQIEGGTIILACRDGATIDVFSGLISQFVKNKCCLYRALQKSGDEDYQFTIKITGDRLRINQLPNAVEKLKKFATITQSTS